MSSLRQKLIHEPALRTHMCAWIAVIQAVIATAYLVLAISDRDTVRSWWFVFAIVMTVLSVWNLLLYEEMHRVRKERHERLVEQLAERQRDS